MPHYDVVISGCGPVGATLASLLASQGLKIRVLEKVAEVYDKPRAIVLDWEAMRALQFAGVAHALSPETTPHPGTDFVGIEGQLIKLFDPVPAPYALAWPATLTFVQPRLEALLREALESRGNVELSFGTQLNVFEDKGDLVQIEIEDTASGDREDITADYLVGCDGSSSAVRMALGAKLEDKQFDEWWVVVDALQQRDTPLPKKTTQYCQPGRPATYVVGPDKLRRWEIKILPDEDPASFSNPDVLKNVLANFVDVDAMSIWRSAVYRFHALVGEEWHRGRVLLAGDAVHQMPPFLGQGLCAGMRDAFNLAWKLAGVQREILEPSVLDSYEEERKPHVSTVIDHAKEFGLIIGELDMEKARLRDKRLQAQLADGTMVTSRQGFIPNLAGGLIDKEAPLAGHLFVQPKVQDDKGETGLLDDILPMEFLYVTLGLESQDWFDGEEERWHAIGGRRIAILPADAQPTPAPTGVDVLYETDGLFAAFAAQNGIKALIVRPDRYIYAAFKERHEAMLALEGLLRKIAFRG